MKWLWVVVLTVMLGFSAAALGGTKETAARTEYQEGTTDYNLGRFDEAAQHYEAAYKLVPDPNMLFNIAQSYRMAGKLEQALPVFRGFLRESPPNAPNRPLAERLAEDIRRKIEEKRATPAPPAPRADTQAPVMPLPATPPAPADSLPPAGLGGPVPAPSAPGATHPVESPGYAWPAGPPSSPPIGFAPGPGAPPPASAAIAPFQVAAQGPNPIANVDQASSASEPARPGKGLRIAGVVCGAAAVVSVTAGVVFSVKTRSYSNRAENDAEWNPATADKGSRYETSQWVFYGIGAGLAVTGAILYWLGASSTPSASSGVAVVPMSDGTVFAAKGVF